MKKVLVIGDIIADAYQQCKFRKHDPSVGRPAIVQQSLEVRPGGAANVAANLCALSPDVRITLIGEIDSQLGRILKRTTANRIDLSYAQITDEMRLTKTRVYQDGQMVVRIDRADCVTSYTAELVDRLLRNYLAENDPDLILLSDYGHGTINEQALGSLLNGRDFRERLMVDTKRVDLQIFEGSLLCKLNQLEWNEVTKKEAAPERFFKYLVVTLGPNGALLQVRRALSPKHTQTDRAHFAPHEVKIVDVCGCGDTFLAGLASSMLKNGDPFTAVQFANAAAATVVSQWGTSVASREEALRLCGLEIEK